MLREFVEQKHYKFAAEAPDWKEAIRMSCESLEADGTIEANYKEDIVACLEKYGPYMVRLSELLMNEEVVAALLKAETPEDLLEIQKQYLD